MRLRPLLTAVSAALASAALFAAGCATHPSDRTGARAMPANETSYAPQQPALPGHAAQIPPWGFDSPSHDLNGVLQQGGGGGHGQSPVVSDSSVRWHASDTIAGRPDPSGAAITPSDLITFPAGWPPTSFRRGEVDHTRNSLFLPSPPSPYTSNIAEMTAWAEADRAWRAANGLPPGAVIAGNHVAGNADRPPPAIAINLPPIITTNPGEELWVIIQPDRLPPPMPYAMVTADAPGCGALMYQPQGHPQPLPFPLEHTAVNAEINGFVASVNVTQRFHNPSSDKIEALYVFPLPHDAAINGFLMTIGERTIRGVIRPREQAERIYEHARAQGHTASLLTQERANIFTQHVANIEPHDTVQVDITYFHTLAYVDGWFEYVFPMVVGPRYNPSLAYTQDPRNPSNQPVATPYMNPGERPGHDISIDIALNAGMPVEEIACNSHRIGVRERSEHDWLVRLDSGATIPNKDFVLRFRVAGDQTRGGLIVQRDITDQSGDGWFTLLLVPPARLESLHRAPVEFVFVIDTSGSMQGEPLALAAAAVDDALRRMVPGDTFQIIRFSDNVSALGQGPLPVTHETIHAGRQYAANLSAGGGTQMIHGIKAALDYPTDRRRQRYVVFLTDGFIGNENEILAAMHDHVGNTRVFSFGIGTSPNRLLLDEMARVGRGAVAYLAPTDNGPAVMSAFFERVAHPALTNVEIDFGGLHAADVFPRHVPDLFTGRPVVITGRYTGDPDRLARDPITIRGQAGGFEHGEPTRVPVEFTIGAESIADPAGGSHGATRGLREVWARSMIREMENQARASGHDRRRDIETTALRNNLMSTFTSFVAVDSSARTAGDWGVSVDQPSYAPAGMGALGEGGR